MSQLFVAGYDDECSECGGDIVGGEDMIVMLHGGAVHEECAP